MSNYILLSYLTTEEKGTLKLLDRDKIVSCCN